MALAVAPARPSKRVQRPPDILQPFTVEHFRAWAADLVLDSGEQWLLEPFQEAFIADVFAGTPECWLIVPEGNGKTTLVAGLALYHVEHRPHASVPVAASSREQAEILYRQAEGFVLRSPRMYQVVNSPIQAAKGKVKTDVPRFTCLEGFRRVNHFMGGRIQVFAADDRTGDGVIPTLGILDELHRHRDLALYRTWAGKLTKRGGQIVAISTAGEPGSDFEMTRERIRQTSGEVIRKGSFVRASGSRIVLHEWALAPKAKPDDFDAVKACNPFSGVTVDGPAGLREKFNSPAMTLAHWQRFVCNLPTRADNAAIQEAEWRAAVAKDPIPAGEHVWVGFDYAPKWDTTALAPLWWKSSEHRQLGPATILVPPRDGTIIDGRLIEAAFLAIHARNPIDTVVMDMSRAELIARWIEREIGARVLDWSQSVPFQVAEYERFMAALGAHPPKLLHAGDVGLTSHALNAIAFVQRQGDAVFERPAQGRGTDQERRVIDALKAASMVHSAAVEILGALVKPKPKLFVGAA